MNESTLKSALVAEIKRTLPGFVVLRHEDIRTAGIPDISVTGMGRTTWLECKHANPRMASTGIQELTMLRLAAAGNAHYLVWEEKRGITRTLVVHPRHLKELLPEKFWVGFEPKNVIQWLKETHAL